MTREKKNKIVGWGSAAAVVGVSLLLGGWPFLVHTAVVVGAYKLGEHDGKAKRNAEDAESVGASPVTAAA